MKAAFFVEQGNDLLVEQVDVRPPGARDVVVALSAAGVCHTDAFIASGGVPCPPAIVGHEGAGVVDWVGSEVSEFRIGDRVIGLTIPRCGVCPGCRRGASFMCTAAALHGPERARRSDGSPLVTTNGLGTFAEAMTVDAGSIFRVDSDLPDEQLALVGCAFTTGYGAVFNTAGVERGDEVLVVGCGGVGQAIVQACRVAGAERIVAVDPVAAKRELALKFGATDACDPADNGLEGVLELVGLEGVDYAFDTVGKPQTVGQSYGAVRRGGAVVVIGLGAIGAEIPIPGTLVIDAKRVVGCVFGSAHVDRDFPRIIELVEQGQLDIASVVSNRVGLDAVTSAMHALETGQTVRSVVTFG